MSLEQKRKRRTAPPTGKSGKSAGTTIAVPDIADALNRIEAAVETQQREKRKRSGCGCGW